MSSLFQIMKKLVMLEGIQRNEGPLGLGPWGTLDPLTESLITPPSLAREVSEIQSENNNEKPNSIYTVAVRWLMWEEVQTSWLCRSPWNFFFFLEKYKCKAKAAIQTHNASISLRFMHRKKKNQKNILSNFQPSQQSNPSYPQEVAQPDRQTIEPNITNPAVAGCMQSIGMLQTE